MARQLLINLAARTAVLADVDQMPYVDVDSLLRRVYGKQKQGAGFGHAKVGGYPVLLRGLSPLVRPGGHRPAGWPQGTAVTETVYRKQIRPVIDESATAMDRLLPEVG